MNRESLDILIFGEVKTRELCLNAKLVTPERVIHAQCTASDGGPGYIVQTRSGVDLCYALVCLVLLIRYHKELPIFLESADTNMEDFMETLLADIYNPAAFWQDCLETISDGSDLIWNLWKEFLLGIFRFWSFIPKFVIRSVILYRLVFPLWFLLNDKSPSFGLLRALVGQVVETALRYLHFDLKKGCLNCPTSTEFSLLKRKSLSHKISFFDLPPEVLKDIVRIGRANPSYLLQLNVKCFAVFSPMLYNNIHCTLPISSTQHILHNDKTILDGAYDTVFPSFLSSVISTSPSFQSMKNIPGNFSDKYHFYDRIQKASNADYMLLNCLPNSLQRMCSNVTLINDVQSMMRLCQNVINNSNSIMKGFIKEFSVDLFFLDDPTLTINGNNTTDQHPLLQNLLSSYKDRQSIQLEEYQVFGNNDVVGKQRLIHRPNSGLAVIDDSLTTRVEPPYDYKRKGIPFKQSLFLSRMYDFALSGGRSQLIKKDSKHELGEFLNLFDDLMGNELSESHISPSEVVESSERKALYERVMNRCKKDVEKLAFVEPRFYKKEQVEYFINVLEEAITLSAPSSGISSSLMCGTLEKHNGAGSSMEIFSKQKVTFHMIFRHEEAEKI